MKETRIKKYIYIYTFTSNKPMYVQFSVNDLPDRIYQTRKYIRPPEQTNL